MMKRRLRWFSLPLLLALGAWPAPAEQATQADFVMACTENTSLDEPVCRCCAEKAEERLTPKSFVYLVALLRKDQSRVEALRAELSVPEIMAAGMFMVGAPGDCAQELEQP